MFVTDQASSQVASVDSKQIMLIKALIAARDILLEDIQKISKAIDQSIDLTNFISNLDDMKFGSILQANLDTADKVLQVSCNPQNGFKVRQIFSQQITFFSVVMLS